MLVVGFINIKKRKEFEYLMVRLKKIKNVYIKVECKHNFKVKWDDVIAP